MASRSHLHSGRVNRAVTDLQCDARKGTARRTGGRAARGQIEVPVVAGAVETVVLHLWGYGTGEVRAFLTVGEEAVRGRTNENAIVVAFRIGEGDRAADRDRIEAGDLPDGGKAAAFSRHVLEGDPGL